MWRIVLAGLHHWIDTLRGPSSRHCQSTDNQLPFDQPEEAKNTDDALRALLKEILSAADQVHMYNPQRYEEKRASLYDRLMQATYASIPAILKDFDLLELTRAIVVDKAINVYPAMRAQYVGRVLEVYDKAHEQHLESVQITKDATTWVVHAVATKFAIPLQASLSSAADGGVIVESSQGATKPAQNREVVTHIAKYVQSLAEREAMSSGDSGSLPTSNLLKRKLMSRVTDHMLNGMMSSQLAPLSDAKISVAVRKTLMKPEGQKTLQFDSDGQCTKLPYLGRVIDEVQAASAPRASIMPIGDNNGIV
jgi:hypothetical protein